MAKRKESQKIRRESNLRDKSKGIIHWTTFNFPPKKTMKLNDILNMSVRENSISKTKECDDALRIIQQKAADFGIVNKAKKLQSFYHTDEEQDKAEKEIL